MESLDYHQIRAYCKEAQEIADEYGVDDALFYLIGEKFNPLLSALKKAEAKVKYLYNPEDVRSEESPLKAGGVTLRAGYSLAVETHYQKSLEVLEDLRHLRDDFLGEMKEAFEISDIMDFLDSYPRLGFKTQKPVYQDDLIEGDSDGLDVEDLFSEIDDVFIVEEIRKLFQ